MAAKVTQKRKLYDLLAKGEPVPVQTIVDTLGVGHGSVAVYISELKRLYKADIESKFELVKSGQRTVRKVTHYQLVKSEKEVPKYRSNNAQQTEEEGVEKTVDEENVGTENVVVPVLDPNSDLAQYGDREVADIQATLGAVVETQE